MSEPATGFLMKIASWARARTRQVEQKCVCVCVCICMCVVCASDESWLSTQTAACPWCSDLHLNIVQETIKFENAKMRKEDRTKYRRTRSSRREEITYHTLASTQRVTLYTNTHTHKKSAQAPMIEEKASRVRSSESKGRSQGCYEYAKWCAGTAHVGLAV